MREVEVHVWCDQHGRGEPAVLTRVVAIDGAKPKALDLCKVCDEELFDYLLHIVERHGVTPGEIEASPRVDPEHARTCPRCGLIAANRQCLSKHTREQHNVGLRALIQAGELVPVQRKETP